MESVTPFKINSLSFGTAYIEFLLFSFGNGNEELLEKKTPNKTKYH